MGKLKRGDYVAMEGPGGQERLGVYQGQEEGKHMVKDHATGHVTRMRAEPRRADAPQGQPAYEALQERIAALEAEKETLRADLEARGREIAELNAEISAKSQRIAELEAAQAPKDNKGGGK